MNWQNKIYESLKGSRSDKKTIKENIYDPAPKGPKPKTRKGSIRSSLRGKAREVWDKAQAEKQKSVSEEDKKLEKKSPQRQAIEDLVRRIAQKSKAAKELGRLATPAISER